MKSLNKTATAVLDALTGPLKEPGDSRKVHAVKAYMAVHISRLGRDVYSVAHYGEQMGDLMADPEMEFFHGADGKWYPFSYRNDYIGQHRYSAEITDGRIGRFNPRMQADQTSFANGWMAAIKQQQGVKSPRARK
jgi:hypothetical protein